MREADLPKAKGRTRNLDMIGDAAHSYYGQPEKEIAKERRDLRFVSRG